VTLKDLPLAVTPMFAALPLSVSAADGSREGATAPGASTAPVRATQSAILSHLTEGTTLLPGAAAVDAGQGSALTGQGVMMSLYAQWVVDEPQDREPILDPRFPILDPRSSVSGDSVSLAECASDNGRSTFAIADRHGALTQSGETFADWIPQALVISALTG